MFRTAQWIMAGAAMQWPVPASPPILASISRAADISLAINNAPLVLVGGIPATR
jgi:hypothetical protein